MMSRRGDSRSRAACPFDRKVGNESERRWDGAGSGTVGTRDDGIDDLLDLRGHETRINPH